MRSGPTPHACGRSSARRARRAGWLRLAVALACPAAAAVVPLLLPAVARAQYQAPSETLQLVGKSAVTWAERDTDVIQLEGGVRLEFDHATLSADRAVVWLSPEPGPEAGRRKVQVALIGDAKVIQDGAVRSGPQILVNASVAGKIRLTAGDRADRDASASDLYRQADAIRRPGVAVPPPPPGAAASTAPGPGSEPVVPPGPTVRPSGRDPDFNPVPPWAATLPGGGTGAGANGSGAKGEAPAGRPSAEDGGRAGGQGSLGVAGAGTRASTAPSTGPSLAQIPGATSAPSNAPVLFDAPSIELVETADDHTVAVVLSGGVKIVHRDPTGKLVEIQGQRAVLLSPIPFKELSQLRRGGGERREIQDLARAVYVEGDARVVFTPPAAKPVAEGRLEATRLYYEFATDRAILTDAVLHAVDQGIGLPIVVHAAAIRQLASGEYAMTDSELSTSLFGVPTYSLRSSKMYLRQDPPAVEGGVGSANFAADDTTFRLAGIPFFYLPRVAGDLSEGKTPLRSISAEHSNIYGTGALTKWGLFETLGQIPPKDADAEYRLDYFSNRGPAAGLNATYKGGAFTEAGGQPQPFSFQGDFKSYFVYDEGTDEIGRPLPAREDGDFRLRGHAQWEHQQFLPDDWQVQLRAGFVSDPTFLEQWFRREFQRDLPHDVSIYLKHQKDTEAFTLLYQFQPNEQVTTSDLQQEQFEVEHTPEVGYHRIGDSVFGNAGTLYSDNKVGGLHFQQSRYSLVEQGFVPGLSPGDPSLGITGVTDDTIWRGDFRQEIDFPFTAGQFRVVPYVMGRYTYYSDSPTDGTIHRLFGGVGLRATTAFWKVDDTIQNDLLDIHRVRHVIEPELNVFTAATTKDQGTVFVFDEPTDRVNDVSAMQLALRQRWQTNRGGPGAWRSVNFLTLNVEANLFNNQPADTLRRPVDFRGLFFNSLPEASIPRNAINADVAWRISDTTALLSDVSWNADKSRLATASVGLVLQRGERTSFYLGNRYIDDLNSNITTAVIDYQINEKYSVSAAQAFDFGQGENVVSSASFIRRFDVAFLVIKGFYDQTTGQSGFGISLVPRGVRAGLDTDVLSSALEAQRR